MNLFRKKQPADIHLEPATTDRLEIEVHKSASKEAKQKADEINNHVRNLLGENGFTVKIFLAAGGHLPAKKNSGTR